MGVLVIDDDAAIRDMLADSLRDEGYQVATSEHGQAALGRLEAGPWLPRLILLDVMMPVMDGLTFARAIHAHPVYSSIPVVAMTAGRDLSGILQILPVVDAIPKPIHLERLLRVVAHYCPPPTPKPATFNEKT